MSEAKHILSSFDKALAGLRDHVLLMAGLSVRSLKNALGGLFERNDDLYEDAVYAVAAEDIRHQPYISQ